jgi:hypothetical protein
MNQDYQKASPNLAYLPGINFTVVILKGRSARITEPEQ